MSIKFYLDSHVSKRIVLQLRKKGVEIIHCDEVGMANASDEEHLIYAGKHGYTLISMDADFPALHTLWVNQNKNHCGIFKISGSLTGLENIGRIVNELFDYYQIIEVGGAILEEEIYNQIIYIR